MHNNRSILVIMLIGISWLTSCMQDDDSKTCRAVEKITPQSTCYDPGNGLTLVAGYELDFMNEGQFIWSVFPQADTALNSNIAAPLEKILAGNETIIIPDSLLKNSPKFVVKVVTDCGNKELHSIYFSFVKRQSTGANCYIWQRQVM